MYLWDPLAVFEAVRAANSVPQVVSHVRHVQKSGLKVPDLVQGQKSGADASDASSTILDVWEGPNCAKDPAQTPADVAGAGDDVLEADTGPMSLRKVRKVVLLSFENSKTKAQQKLLT